MLRFELNAVKPACEGRPRCIRRLQFAVADGWSVLGQLDKSVWSYMSGEIDMREAADCELLASSESLAWID